MKLWPEGLKLWYADLIVAQATPGNKFKFSVSQKKSSESALKICAYIEAKVSANLVNVTRGGSGTMVEASKAVVAMGKLAFLVQAPGAMSRWKDQSGSTHDRNTTKNSVIYKLKRKAGIAGACAEAHVI